MKGKLKNHVLYHLWFYFLSALVVSVLWISVFHRLAEPAPDEQVNICIFSDSADVEALEAELARLLPAWTGRDDQTVAVELANVEDGQQFQSLLWTRTQEYDLILVETKRLFGTFGQSYFAPMDEAVARNYFGGAQLYREENAAYGVYAGNGITLEDYCGASNRFCLFFPVRSVHTGTLYRENASVDDAALWIVAWLLEGDV